MSNLKKIFQLAEKLAEEWNESEKRKRCADDFFLSLIGERGHQLAHELSSYEVGTLIKELAWYLADVRYHNKEGSFIEHLQEWAEELLED